jgi:hypothetical protein
VLQYLNNLPEGEGHTVFPSLKVNGRPLSSQPQRLKALLWCNVLENGEPDARLIHRYPTHRHRHTDRDTQTQSQAWQGLVCLDMILSHSPFSALLWYD